MGRRITILGMGPTAFRKADVINQFVSGTEVWSLNNAYMSYPVLTENKGFHRYFEIHSWDYLQDWKAGETVNGDVDHCATMHRLGCPIYVVDRLPIIHNQVDLPRHGIMEQFGTDVELKGSPSWMLATALYEHTQGDEIEYIQSWGIDTSDERHKCQRPSWAQWTLRAEMMGIEIGGSALNFRLEKDDDSGLQGLAEITKNELQQQQNKKEEVQDELRSSNRLVRIS